MAFPVFLHDIARLGAHPHNLFSQHSRRIFLNHSKVYLDFILTLANELGILVKYDRGWGKGKRFETLLEEKAEELWVKFFEVFLNTSQWDELRYVVKLSSIGDRMGPSEVRKFVLKNLKKEDTLEEFVARIRESNPEFYRKMGDTNWKIRRERRVPEWEELEACLLKIIIEELAWLGIVVFENGHIKLTSEGEAVVKGKSPRLPLAKPVVKPDYEIIVPKNVHPNDIYFLEKIGERSSEDSVFIYRINSFSIQQAIEEGLDVQGILTRMEEWGSLPQNVTENVKSWASRFSKIKMKFGVIMEFEEPSLLREILSLRSLERYITQVTPTIALVKAKDMQKVGELLKSKGYFAEIPQEWLEKKVLFLSREETILLKKVLEEVKYELKFPQNTIIDDIIERLDKDDSS